MISELLTAMPIESPAAIGSQLASILRSSHGHQPISLLYTPVACHRAPGNSGARDVFKAAWQRLQMTIQCQSANAHAPNRPPLVWWARLAGMTAGSIFMLSCSTTSGEKPLLAQNALTATSSIPHMEALELDTLRSHALAGNAEAQYHLAKRYATNDTTHRDYVQAGHWWYRAAQQGLAKAQYALGILYANGHGVKTDYTQAVYWYRQAAEQGLAQAQYNLGTHYWLGEGVPRDPVAAVSWLHQAADQGIPQAQYNLARLLEKGIGAPQDLEAAREWDTRAAAQGLAAAQHHLRTALDTLDRKPANP